MEGLLECRDGELDQNSWTDLDVRRCPSAQQEELKQPWQRATFIPTSNEPDELKLTSPFMKTTNHSTGSKDKDKQ